MKNYKTISFKILLTHNFVSNHVYFQKSNKINKILIHFQKIQKNMKIFFYIILIKKTS